MPQIIVEYDLERLDDEQLARIGHNLSHLCSQLFSVNKWQIRPDDFSLKFDKVEWPNRTTHNVIVRMLLHDFEERRKHAQEHAEQIRNEVLTVLASYGAPSITSVGVSLGYLPIEWSERVIYPGEL